MRPEQNGTKRNASLIVHVMNKQTNRTSIRTWDPIFKMSCENKTKHEPTIRYTYHVHDLSATILTSTVQNKRQIDSGLVSIRAVLVVFKDIDNVVLASIDLSQSYHQLKKTTRKTLRIIIRIRGVSHEFVPSYIGRFQDSNRGSDSEASRSVALSYS